MGENEAGVTKSGEWRSLQSWHFKIGNGIWAKSVQLSTQKSI